MEMFNFLMQYIKKVLKWIILILLITIVLSIVLLVPPQVSKLVFNEGILSNNLNLILRYGAVLFIMYLIIFFLKIIQSVTFAKVKNIFIAYIKRDVFEHIMYLPLEFYEKHKTGYILKKITEVDSVSFVFSSTTANFVTSIIAFIGASIIMCSINMKLYLVAVICMPLYYFISNHVSKIIRRQSFDLLEANASAQGFYHESINGIQLIKELNAEEIKLKNINDHIDKIVNKSIAQTKSTSIGIETLVLITKLLSVVFMIIIGIYITEGMLTVGDYVALSQYLVLIYSPVQLLSNMNISIQPSIAAFKRLKPILEMKKERDYYGNKEVHSIDSIKFENVKFSYPGGIEYVLNNVDFSISTGDIVVLEGINGSGKSTIIKLLTGLYSSYVGNIFFNDIELKKISLKSLRNKEAIVSQNIYLFSGSVLENILLSGENYSFEDIKDMMDILQIEYIDTKTFVVEENGKNMSGGEKQKIALLRALMRKTDLFIFDEAISNLDKKTKNIILEKLKNSEFKNKICIIISHDDVFDEIANKHLNLTKGKITETIKTCDVKLKTDTM